MSIAIEPHQQSDHETPVVRKPQAADSPLSPEANTSATSRWQQLLKYGGSLVDQSFVSGTRFLTSILIGASNGAAELGNYALGFSILMGFHCVQLSLISRPYTIYGSQVDGQERRELAGSVLVQFIVFGLLTTAALLSVVGIQNALSMTSALTPVLFALAFATPLILLREHARQFCFAHLHVGQALLVDTVSTVIHVAGIGWLAWTGELTAVSAIVTTGLASGISGLVWLVVDHHSISIATSRIVSDFRRQWGIGRWDCASEIAFVSQIYGLTWLLAFIMDDAAVGVYSACMMSIQILNPFLLGMNSLLVPKTARAFSEGGTVSMHSFVRQTTLAIGVITAGFATITAIWGPEAIEFLYRGQGFEIPGIVVAALAFGVVVEVISIGPENGLWAMERHDFNFRVVIVGGIATLISALALIPAFGLAGAAFSYLIGRLFTAIAHWIAYRLATREMKATEASLAGTPAT